MNYTIEQLQRRFADYSNPEVDVEPIPRLSVWEVAGRLHLEFCGSPLGKPYDDLYASIVQSDVASVLSSISLRSPWDADEGINGTRDWDLSWLARADVIFPNLRSFSVEQNRPGGHNRVVAEHTGALRHLLRKAPRLEQLTVPSAPDRSFFELESHPLRYLNVDAGYDTQGFIANLASSSCFPSLGMLEFGEYNETYVDDFPVGCTPFDDYRRLFVSEAFASVKSFVWRNPICSDSELMELRKLRSSRPGSIQIMIVQFSSRHI
ncbi:MAG TPA: hypothetical protein VJ302_01410 [Blastocatellia bacterium]|nr:hypothetical protein [Blastocatellia bacterium]